MGQKVKCLSKVDLSGICGKRVMANSVLCVKCGKWIHRRYVKVKGMRENEMAILRRTERAMVRAMCSAKLMEKKRTEDLMEILQFKETVVQMAKANGMRWYGHVLRRNDGHDLRKALEFEEKGKRKRGRPKKTWKSVGLEKEDALNRAR